MKALVFILLFITPFSYSQEYPLKNGKPTSEGIRRYIEDNRDSLVREYQSFTGDTLYDVLIYTDDFGIKVGQDSLELGWYFQNEVIISTDTLFIAYELADLSRFERASHPESNKFVKSTVFHELTHYYIHLIKEEMEQRDRVTVNRAYAPGLWIVRGPFMFGSTFIEEGICEYQVGRMGEIIVPKRPIVPETREQLTSGQNRYEMVYKYAAYYLQTFLDTTGFKKGVKILMHNPPPSYEEILKPELFFGRLEYPEDE